MKSPELQPHEQAALDKAREAQQGKQPYAAEIDDRALERAQKENRPVDPNGKTQSEPRR